MSTRSGRGGNRRAAGRCRRGVEHDRSSAVPHSAPATSSDRARASFPRGVNLASPRQSRQLVEYMTASFSASSHSSSLTDRQSSPISTSLPVRSSTPMHVDPGSEDLFEDAHSQSLENVGDFTASVSPSSVQHNLPTAGAEVDDDETQISEGHMYEQEGEESDDPVDDEVLDRTYNPHVEEVESEEEEEVVAVEEEVDEVSDLAHDSQTQIHQAAALPGSSTVRTSSSMRSREIPGVTSGRLRGSPAWDFFQRVPDSLTDVRCNLCSNRYSRGRNPKNLTTTVMTRHLNNNHTIVWKQHLDKLSKTSSRRSLPFSTFSVTNPPSTPQSTLSSPSSHSTTHNIEGQTPPAQVTPADSQHSSTQMSVQQMWSRKTPLPPTHPTAAGLTSSLALLLATEMLPFRLVETESFRRFVSIACPRYTVPSRHYFSRTAIPSLSNHIVNNITKALRESVNARVHFTTDTWTSKHGQGRYITLTAHWVNLVAGGQEGGSVGQQILKTPRLAGQSSVHSPSSVPSYCSARAKRRQAVLHMRSLGDRSHTAPQLWEALSEDFEHWLTPLNLTPGNVVSDNASNLVAALRQGGLRHMPCMAHVLNLVVQKFLKLYPGLQALLHRVRDVCAHFRRSAPATARLAALQRSLGLPVKRLIVDVTTRWNSTLHMLQRVCQQRQAIVQYVVSHRLGQRGNDVGHFSPSEWGQLKDLCSVLHCFDMATDMLSGEDTLISICVPIVFLLEQTLTELRSSVFGMGDSEEEEEMAEEGAQALRSTAAAVSEGGGATTQAAAADYSEEGSDIEEQCEEEAHGTTTLVTGLQSSVLVRGWLEQQEDDIEYMHTATPRGIGERGSVSHMSAFMLHYLQHDPRIKKINVDDYYWLSTLLDPRYKSRFQDMLGCEQSDRESCMQEYQKKIVANLLCSFPTAQAHNTSIASDTDVQANPPEREAHVSRPRAGHTGHSSSTRPTLFNRKFNWFFSLASQTTQVSHVSSHDEHEARLEKMVHDYVCLNLDASILANPFNFWVSKMDMWPELAQHAIEVLSCPAASVLSERVFSAAGNVLTDLRTSLSTESVNRLTQIKMNRAWISNDFHTPAID